MFPVHRLRRLRRTSTLRSMVQETRLHPSRWVLPLFVHEDPSPKTPIPSMPGHFRWSVDSLPEIVETALERGVKAFILFGIPASKDDTGTGAYMENGVVPLALRRLRRYFDVQPVLLADVCMCEYTTHGHCGIFDGDSVDNDATLKLLGKAAVAYAEAGADMVAPSAMMDGQVQAIRNALDEAKFSNVAIMAYAAKYASCFYGPFRDAAGSTPAFGDRRGYQMAPPNAQEALTEIALDVAEGADILMVKPALPYLDIIHAARKTMSLPLAAYQVSGEFSMIKAACEKGWLEEPRAVYETLTAIHRAGADMVLTYFAIQAAQWLNDGTFDRFA